MVAERFIPGTQYRRVTFWRGSPLCQTVTNAAPPPFFYRADASNRVWLGCRLVQWGSARIPNVTYTYSRGDRAARSGRSSSQPDANRHQPDAAARRQQLD